MLFGSVCFLTNTLYSALITAKGLHSWNNITKHILASKPLLGNFWINKCKEFGEKLKACFLENKELYSAEDIREFSANDKYKAVFETVQEEGGLTRKRLADIVLDAVLTIGIIGL